METRNWEFCKSADLKAIACGAKWAGIAGLAGSIALLLLGLCLMLAGAQVSWLKYCLLSLRPASLAAFCGLLWLGVNSLSRRLEFKSAFGFWPRWPGTQLDPVDQKVIDVTLACWWENFPETQPGAGFSIETHSEYCIFTEKRKSVAKFGYKMRSEEELSKRIFLIR